MYLNVLEERVSVSSGSWWWTGNPGVLHQGITKSQIWMKDWTEEIIVKNLQSLVKDINLYCCYSVGKFCSTLWNPENCSTPSFSVLPYLSVQVSSVTQLCLTLCSPMDCSMPGLLIHHQLPELVQTHVHWLMPSNHFTLCCPLLLLNSIFPSNRIFSNESVFHIRWPKYWSFSLSISPSNAYSGLISFRIDWFDLLEVQGTL